MNFKDYFESQPENIWDNLNEMWSTEMMRKLNKDDAAELIEDKPMPILKTGKDAKKSPNYSSIKIEDIEKITGMKEVDTFFVDKTGMDKSGPALTPDAFFKEVDDLLKKDKNLYSAITSEGQFQVYITVFKK